MADATVKVRGYRELLGALKEADKRTQRYVRSELRIAGNKVREEGRRRFSSYGSSSRTGGTFGGSRASHAESAEHYRTVVRARGVTVEQSLRKTTGLHGEYGAVQMRRGLVPALESERVEFETALGLALDRIADHFNHGGTI